jgi:pimeloyl-ACP methyl ester carboxylesterase
VSDADQLSGAAAAWRDRGEFRTLCGRRIFTVEVAPLGRESAPPLLVLHGFPTSSFDFHLVVDRLAASRRVVLFDMLGYGLSEKPDLAYRLEAQADLAMALTAELGIDRLSLLTHDMGDTVGGELLARQLEGDWDVEITERTLTNGSIYIELAHLSAGQQLLLSLPDQALEPEQAPDRTGFTAALAATFSPQTVVDEDELDAAWQQVAYEGGNRLLPRTIRYIEQRRQHQERYTGAIERHPSALTVVWGRDDPIAVVEMVDRLRDARPDATIRILDGVGHYLTFEAPDRFLAALPAGTG